MQQNNDDKKTYTKVNWMLGTSIEPLRCKKYDVKNKEINKIHLNVSFAQCKQSCKSYFVVQWT